jgi:hypothetical protein
MCPSLFGGRLAISTPCKVGDDLASAGRVIILRGLRGRRTDENAATARCFAETGGIEGASDHDRRNNGTGRVNLPEIIRARGTLPEIRRANRLRAGLHFKTRFKRRRGRYLDPLAVQRQLEFFSLDSYPADAIPPLRVRTLNSYSPSSGKL